MCIFVHVLPCSLIVNADNFQCSKDSDRSNMRPRIKNCGGLFTLVPSRLHFNANLVCCGALRKLCSAWQLVLQSIAAMEICFLVSGETLAVPEPSEFQCKSAKNLKQSLAARIGVSRFRQKFDEIP